MKLLSLYFHNQKTKTMQIAIDFTKHRFDGSNYDHNRDGVRLGKQLDKIFNIMKDGVPRTLSQIESLTGEPQASISAQLRHLRKERFGSHLVDKIHCGNGLYLYSLKLND